MLGGYFNRNLPQGTIAVLKVEDTKHPATKMLGAELAARRRVLPVRHRAVGCGAARRQHRRALQEQDPDGLLARSRARAAQPRHRAHGHVEAAEPEARRRLSAGVDARGTARAERSTPRSGIATTSGATIRCSARTSTEAFDGRSGSSSSTARGLAALAGLRASGSSAPRRASSAASSGVSSSPSQLGQSRSGDRVLHEGVSLNIEGNVRRSARVAIAEQRVGVVQQGRRAAGHAAANRVLAFRLARHRRARDARSLSETEHPAACRSTPGDEAPARCSSAATPIRDPAACWD